MRTNKSDFLKECIADAILELLKTNPLDKISIIEITSKAGVGRATYFRNFSSKQEAITYKIISLWYQWCEKRSISHKVRYTIDTAADFFEFSYNYKVLYKLLYNNNLQTTIYDAFYDVIMKQERSSPEEYYKSRFLSYGVYGIVDEWVKRDFEEKPNKIAVILHKTIVGLQND